MCIINEDKWKTLDNRDSLKIVNVSKGTFSISDVEIKNPDNPARLKNAKLITFIMTKEEAGIKK